MEEEIEETEETEVEAKRGGEIDRTLGPNHVPDLTLLVIVMAKKRKSVHTMMIEIETIAEIVVGIAEVIEIAAEVVTEVVIEIVETADAMIAGVEEVVPLIKRVRSAKEVLVAKARKSKRDHKVLIRAQRNLLILLAQMNIRNSFR